MNNVEKMNILNTQYHHNEILDLCWLNSKEIFTASADGTAKVYNIDQNKVICTIEHFDQHGNPAAVNTVACSDPELTNPQLLITGSSDGSVKVWDQRFVIDGPIHTFNTPYPICSVICDKKLSKLLFSGLDDTIYGFDLITETQYLKLKGHGDIITSLSLSEDESIMTSYGADNHVIVYDVRPIVSEQREKNGRIITRYSPSSHPNGPKQNRRVHQFHKHKIFTMASSVTASKSFVGIIVPSIDGNSYLFDLNQPNGQPIKINQHEGPVNGLDTYKQWLVTAGMDGKIILGALKF
jgi:denticleless